MNSRVFWQWSHRHLNRHYGRFRSRLNQARSHYQTGVQRKCVERFSKRAFLFSATGLYKVSAEPAANDKEWNDYSITDDSLNDLSDEMLEMERLKLATLVCKACRKNLIIGKPLPDKEYCSCPHNHAVEDPITGWQPYIENKDIIIWRKEPTPGDGLYAYKVYGRYSEVFAEDFLAMHIDMDYWKSWDTTAVSVTVLDDKKYERGGETVIHWESLWPRFFANRDYVYIRRFAHLENKKFSYGYPDRHNDDRNDNLIVIISRSCEHPEAPENNKTFRVKKYWSNLVIKPFTEKSEPGIEFSLTYFDDPGASIPVALQTWVAGQACPEFMAKMRVAACAYKKGFLEETPEEKLYHGEKVLTEIESKACIQMNEDSLVENPASEESNNISLLEKPCPIPKKTISPIIAPIPVKLENQTDEIIEESQSSSAQIKVTEHKKDPQHEDEEQSTNKLNFEESPKTGDSQSQSGSYWSYWNYWPLYYFS